MDDDEYEIPNDDDVTAEDIQAGADLSDADLSGADLSGANLSDADLSNAKLNESDFSHANLSDADLTEANGIHIEFFDCDLSGANLSEGVFIHSNFQDSNIFSVDFSEANIKSSDLRGCDLRACITTGLELNASTRLGRQSLAESPSHTGREWMEPIFGGSPPEWDTIARSHHSFKIACHENGVINKARKQHYLERRARGYDLKNSINLNPWFTATWLGSFLSRVFIGYGVRVRRLLATMTVLFVGSTAVFLAYGVGGDATIDTISYSVRAFTVAPPTAPEQFLPHVVMMVETFFGTLSIVLLGYVLSNREQF